MRSNRVSEVELGYRATILLSVIAMAIVPIADKIADWLQPMTRLAALLGSP